MVKQTFTRALRLRRTGDFQQIFKQGHKLRLGYLVTYTKPNAKGHARLGIVIAKKAVSEAVSRNRFKRIIRESFRLNRHILPNLDIVIVMNRPLYNNQELLCDLDKQWLNLADSYRKA